MPPGAPRRPAMVMRLGRRRRAGTYQLIRVAQHRFCSVGMMSIDGILVPPAAGGCAGRWLSSLQAEGAQPVRERGVHRVRGDVGTMASTSLRWPDPRGGGVGNHEAGGTAADEHQFVEQRVRVIEPRARTGLAIGVSHAAACRSRVVSSRSASCRSRARPSRSASRRARNSYKLRVLADGRGHHLVQRIKAGRPVPRLQDRARPAVGRRQAAKCRLRGGAACAVGIPRVISPR